MVRVSELDFGLQVVTDEMTEVRSAALGFWVGTGSRDEPPEMSGASHFLEHLLFKGTRSRSARDIAEAIDAVGGDLNAFTTKEYTAFHVRLLADDIELGLDILSDIVWSPSLRMEEVEAERQVILEEILMREDDYSDMVHDLIHEKMFAGHPLGRDVLGTAETISSIPRDAIAEFCAHHYRPRNMVFAAAGRVDHDAIVRGLERRFTGELGGEHPKREPPSAGGEGNACVERDTEQCHVAIGVPSLNRYHDDRYALAIVDQTLGGGISSRLFQDVREKRGLAYSVYSGRAGYDDCGVATVYAGTAPHHADEVSRLLDQALDDVSSEGLTEREFQIAKGQLKSAILLGAEDSGDRMSRIASSLLLHGEVPEIDEVIRRIDAVRPDDVARVSRAVYGAPRTTAIVGPMEAA